MFLATSSIPAGQPFIQYMDANAVLELPVSSTSIQSLIELYAQLYDVSPTLMRGIIRRESGYNQYAVGDHGTSHGLVQIHQPAHPDITLPQADNPIFAINYLAQQLSLGHGYMWSTYKAALRDRSPPSQQTVVSITSNL